MSFIKFIDNPQKLIEVILFILQEKPQISLRRLQKLIFQADRLHLNLHGRTITGITYVQGHEGPFAPKVHELVQQQV